MKAAYLTATRRSVVVVDVNGTDTYMGRSWDVSVAEPVDVAVQGAML